MATRQEFDELVRQEIRKAGGSQRGDPSQAARDRVARRLNAQEGRSRNSTAYTPSAPKKQSTSGGKGVTSKKKGPGKKPSKGPGTNLPATTDVVPTPRPGEDTSMRGGIMAAIMAAALAAAGGARYFRGGKKPGAPGGEGGSPTRYPWDQPSAGAAPTEQSPSRYPWDQPSAAAPPPVDEPARAPVAEAAPAPLEEGNPRFGTVAPEDVGGLNEGQIRDIITRAQNAPGLVESGGDVGGRLGGTVYRPGIDAPSPSPGLHGSRFGQPILKPRVIVRP